MNSPRKGILQRKERWGQVGFNEAAMNSPRKGRPYNWHIFRQFHDILREVALKLPNPSIVVHRRSVQVLFLVQITCCERVPGFVHHQTARCNVNA